MLNVPSVRVTVPKAAAGEIIRKNLIETVLNSPKGLVYIHAGAGYGKTTLLSQIAKSREYAVWLSLDGENDIFIFVNTLCEAVKQTFPEFDFAVSEYLPFSGKDNFISILAGALICSIENITVDFVVLMDDLHTIEEAGVKQLIACLIKYPPKNTKLCFGSREGFWQDFLQFKIKGDILEVTQKELAFTKEETAGILGFDDPAIYGSTEGWPLAVGSFKILLENGIAVHDIPSRGNEVLYAYLLNEYIGNLNSDMMDFLKKSACFDELDAQMLSDVLNKKNAKLILENLVARNVFTIKTGEGFYRYHALFRNSLLEAGDEAQKLLLRRKAARYYFDKKQYSRAAGYATNSKDAELLGEIILACYRDYIKMGNYNELRIWFQSLDSFSAELSPEILVAKGALSSVVGNFVEANACLDAALPLLNKADKSLYFEAMIHKARVLRNFISFEASNRLLDELIDKLDAPVSELSYTVMIEKIYNLCWNSQINEACALACHSIEICAKAGNVKVKAWFERYLSVIHFLAGRMKESVYYYEKSLELPENERRHLSLHSIDICAAKAYQMMGERDKAVSMITAELQKLRSMGRYEELWIGYLLAAEIHYQNASIDRMNGGSKTFETTKKYFTLADEYAPLYRKTEFQMQWTKMQGNIYSLIFTDSPKESIVDEIYKGLDQVGDYYKTIALARLFSYFVTVSDFSNAVKYAKLSIEIGERANMMLMATMAYGVLARIAIGMKDHEKSVSLTKRFLKLCDENGIYEYFRMRKAYDPILEFAFDNGIEPAFTEQMMAFAGYKTKKAYIRTLGGFSVFSFKNRQEPLKMRARKERELLAFLLNAGSGGVTKEQIYNAIWTESESADVKNLIGVSLTNIKNALASLGIENPVINHEKHYRICRDEITLDTDLFEKAVEEFRLQNSKAAAQKILDLYKGEYLCDFEAFWAVSKRIKYSEIYEEALKYCL